MAVIWYKEVWPDRDGHTDVSSEKNYKRMFIVQTDTTYDGPAVVLQYFHDTEGLPWIGDPYDNSPVDSSGDPLDVEDTEGDSVPSEEFDTDCICVNLDPKQMAEDAFFWMVTVYYTNRPSHNPAEYGLDPTEREPVVTWSSQIYTKALQVDFSSPPRLIANSYNLPFGNPSETEYSYSIVTIRRWEKSGADGFNPGTMAHTYENKVNSVDWKATLDDAEPEITIPARCAKMKAISSERRWEQGAIYYLVTYVIHIKWDTWDYKPLDASFRGLDPNTNKPITFIAPGGLPSGTPGLLDGTGKFLNGTDSVGNASIGLPDSNHPPVYFDGLGNNPKPFWVLDSKDFGGISPKLYIPTS